MGYGVILNPDPYWLGLLNEHFPDDSETNKEAALGIAYIRRRGLSDDEASAVVEANWVEAIRSILLYRLEREIAVVQSTDNLRTLVREVESIRDPMWAPTSVPAPTEPATPPG